MTPVQGSEGLNSMWYSMRMVLRRSVMSVFALVFASFQWTDAAVGSEWTQREFAKFRLLPSTTTVDTSSEVLIGLEIDLDPGWQFYSESPGEFGVAPTLDWTASRNLATASVYWPEPTEYLYSTDPPVRTLGYKGFLLVPVVLVPEQVSEEFDIRLVLEYAICDEFCIIDTVGLRLTLPAGRGKTTRHSERLQQTLADAKEGTW